MARRSDAKFNKIILRRLFMSRINRPPCSIARISRQMNKPGRAGKITVVVGTVTNDDRIFKIPKIKVKKKYNNLLKVDLTGKKLKIQELNEGSSTNFAFFNLSLA